MITVVWVFHLTIGAVVAGQAIGQLNEVVFAKDDTTSILGRANDVGFLVRYEIFQVPHSKRRAESLSEIAVLDRQRNAQKGSSGTSGASLVRVLDKPCRVRRGSVCVETSPSLGGAAASYGETRAPMC